MTGKKSNSPSTKSTTRGNVRVNAVDHHVGSRVRLRRTLLGISQEKLGEAIGLTFQQVQKYERGTNRISAGRLYELSKILDISIDYFFDSITDKAEETTSTEFGEASKIYQVDMLAKRETQELIRSYYRITDPAIRKKIFELIKSMAKASNSELGDKAEN